jgi:dolichyl-phosphate-mannose--protein O-mannosyl transferase
MDRLWTLTEGRQRAVVYIYTWYAVFLFALYYPVLSGLTIPTKFCYYFLKWFPTWPLG